MNEKEPFRTYDELKNTVEIIKQRCEVLLTHIVGEECPSCGEHKVVEGCIKGCLACDWKEIIDEGN